MHNTKGERNKGARIFCGNAYDGAGQNLVANNPNSKRITYTYDSVGLRRSMDAPDAGRFTYTYDAIDQTSLVLNPYTERTSYNYDNAARRTVQRFSNGTRASFIYDNASNLTQLHNRTSAGAAITTFDYKYDSVNNRTGALGIWGLMELDDWRDGR